VDDLLSTFGAKAGGEEAEEREVRVIRHSKASVAFPCTDSGNGERFKWRYEGEFLASTSELLRR
jgi:hypothetical protein